MKPERLPSKSDFEAELTTFGALAVAVLMLTYARGASLVPALCLATAAIPFIYRGVTGCWPAHARKLFDLGLALARSARLGLSTAALRWFARVPSPGFDSMDRPPQSVVADANDSRLFADAFTSSPHS